MPSSVVSADGTVIGYESVGAGPPLVLVHGGTADRSRWAPVRQSLAERYTVHILDRRGRGLSTVEASSGYSIQREAEDIAAVVEAVGSDVYLVAHSYGALCSLEAALITSAIGRLTVYEPPMPTPGLEVVPLDVVVLMKSISEPEKLLETFFREALRVPQEAVDGMKGTPIWTARLAAVHTIIRELDQVVAYVPGDRLAKIDIPVRMLVGTESPAYLRAATADFAARIASAEVVELPGQAHQAMDYAPELFVRSVL